MRKVILAFAVLLFCFEGVTGQQIIKEKFYPPGYNRHNWVFGIAKTNTGYLATGYLDSTGVLISRNAKHPEIVLLNLDSNFKLISTVNLRIYPYSMNWYNLLHSQGELKKGPDGNFLLPFTYRLPISMYPRGFSGSKVIKVNQQGNILWQREYPELAGHVFKSHSISADGGMMISGIYGPDSNKVAFVMFINSQGDIKWKIDIEDDFIDGVTDDYISVEAKDGSNSYFVLSGPTNSKNMATIEIDTAGNLYRPTIYPTDSGGTYHHYGCVLQSPGGYRIVIDTKTDSAGLVYKTSISKHDILGQRLWIRSNNGTLNLPAVNSQGEILTVHIDELASPAEKRLRKYNADGSLAGSIELPNDSLTAKALFAMSWEGNGTAVYSGSCQSPVAPGFSGFYFARMTGLGNDFTLLKNLPGEKQNSAVTICPNPARSTFSINSKAPGILSLYNNSGQLLSSRPCHPGTTIDVSELSPGLYMYRFQNEHGMNTGKLVKE
ncbi:MAG: T9SS type A sorting domain-containing protein [Bacteroidota bacterium]